jgi:NAD(P)-dependent dehydrogenase (short-subunit alcohol dehydrogenase family)
MGDRSSSRVWFITGCSSGLGQALATRVLAHGHRVAATPRRPEQLDSLRAAYPAACRAIALDVIQPAVVKSAVAQTVETFGRILETMDGRQPGDPLKAADAIIAAVESEVPPLRLVLGKYAQDRARRRFADAEKERALWERVGLSADFSKNG